jgi:hypothetical protein
MKKTIPRYRQMLPLRRYSHEAPSLIFGGLLILGAICWLLFGQPKPVSEKKLPPPDPQKLAVSFSTSRAAETPHLIERNASIARIESALDADCVLWKGD